MKFFLALLLICCQFYSIGQDKQEDKLQEFQNFQVELTKHKALQNIRNGAIINPYWGITNPFYSRPPFKANDMNSGQCEEYKLKWIEKISRGDFKKTKAEDETLCDFLGFLMPNSISSKTKRKDKDAAHQYSLVGKSEIGTKFIKLEYVLSYPIVQMPYSMNYYFENTKVEFSEQDKSLLKDSSLNLFGSIWYFFPALNNDLSFTKNSLKIRTDSNQIVLAALSLAKKISLNEEFTEKIQLDSSQTYACKYLIEQFTDKESPAQITSFTIEKSAKPKNKEYAFRKSSVTLSAKDFFKEGYNLSKQGFNKQEKGVYPFSEKYAVFFQYNFMERQAGYSIVESVCLCEKQ